jgi:hypothetical protein
MKLPGLSGLLPAVAVAVTMAGGQSNQDEGAQSIELTVLAQGSYSGVDTERFEVIRDESTFRSLWMAHTAGISPAPPLPQLDFANEMVIAAFAGTKNTGGYSLNISSLVAESKKLKVILSLIQPAPGCMVSQVLTQPYVIVKTAKSPKPVNFDLSATTSSCASEG